MMALTIDMTSSGLEELVERISKQCSSTHSDPRTPSVVCQSCEDVNGILIIASYLKDVETGLYERLDGDDIDEKDLDDELQRQLYWSKQQVEVVLARAEIRNLRTKVERLEVESQATS
jgi:hypothetical protein